MESLILLALSLDECLQGLTERPGKDLNKRGNFPNGGKPSLLWELLSAVPLSVS